MAVKEEEYILGSGKEKAGDGVLLLLGLPYLVKILCYVSLLKLLNYFSKAA